MSSRKRVLKTLEHSEPDKIPYDLSGTTVTAITKTAFINAMKLRNLSCDFIMHDDRKSVDTLAKDGGYVFSAIHSIQADVPAENFWAMWEEFQKIRG